MTTTTIETPLNRQFFVHSFGDTVDLDVRDTAKNPDDGSRVYSLLRREQAEKLALALLGENAVVITDLPEVTVNALYGKTAVRANNWAYHDDKNPEDLLADAKSLLAIHKFLVEKKAKDAEAEAEKAKAEEEAKAAEYEAIVKRDKRRDELVAELGAAPYHIISSVAKAAIDRIIELEAAQA